MDVVIAGASGFIGCALARALEADGHRVLRLVRPSSDHGVGETVAWDPESARIDAHGLEGVDAVVNLGGVGIGDRKWTDDRKESILDSRLAATTLLATTVASLARPPSVFVSASAVGYYGDRGDEDLDETSEPGHDFLAQVCTQWEDAAQHAAAGGTRVATIRTGIVLDRSGGMLGRILLPFRLGLGGRLGRGTQYMSWITLADEIAAIRKVIGDPGLSGAINATAPHPVTNAEFTATLGKVLGRPTAIPTPLAPLKLRYGAELVQALLLASQRALPTQLQRVDFAFSHHELEPALRAVLAKE